MPEQKVRTSEILQRLLKTENINQFIKRNNKNMKSTPLHIILNHLCTERNTLPAYVIEKSGIERSFGHQLFNGSRKASRDKVLQIAFGFEMNYEEVRELLKMAQMSALYPKIERDAVIIFALNRGLPLSDLQATLSELSLPLLGEVKK